MQNKGYLRDKKQSRYRNSNINDDNSKNKNNRETHLNTRQT